MTDEDVANPFEDDPLTPVEARVLGVLIEKQATTPEAYPLTLNAAVTAANQKTSREPVMNLEPGQAGQALRRLEQRGLTHLVMGARADRWEHRADRALELVPAQLTLLALLLLRGPQTVGELYTRSSRMHRFEDTEQVHHHVQRLLKHGLATQLPRQTGQREERYAHTLSGPVEWTAPPPEPRAAAAPAEASPELLARIEALEARVAELEAKLE